MIQPDRTEIRKKQKLNELPTEEVSYDGETLFRLLPAEETGIDFENIIIETDSENTLTYSYMYNGGGVAAGDINNDGLVDLFFTSNQDGNRLYLNKGKMRFEDISRSAGIADSRGWHSGVNMADVNGDGWLDIYVCRSGPGEDKSRRSNLLFINNQDLHFSEAASDYGIDDTNHSTQAGFFDYDQDGDLDLYVLNHPVFFHKSKFEVLKLIQQPAIAQATTDNLYRNNGDGTFSNVTSAAGVLNHGYGLGLVTADLNGDGWTDIYAANDFSTPDFMFINQKDGTFEDEINERTRHISYYGMGCDLIDLNRDKRPDIVELDMTARDRIRSKTLMPSMAPEVFWGLIKDLNHQYQYMFNTLQLNQGGGYFSEIGLMAGVAKTDWSWAVLGADFDHDGWDDLMVTNGFRRDSKDNDFLARYRKAKATAGGLKAMIRDRKLLKQVEQIPSQRIRNYLFKNNGDLTFSDKSIEWGFHLGSFSNGAAYADLDADGDLDLAVNNIDDPAFIFENLVEQQFPERHYLRVQPVNENGIPVLNSRVQVSTANQTYEKELTTCRGFQSAVEPVLHFGLGTEDRVESVTVFWPDDAVTVLNSVDIDQTIKVSSAEKNSGSLPDTKQTRLPVMRISETQIQAWHSENEHDEYETEILLPHGQSSLGPSLAVADVNRDGRDDIFFGGAKGQSATLQLQQEDGGFSPAPGQPWSKFPNCENVAALFFDADGDEDSDLYVVNGGGSEFQPDDPLLNDLFFRNNDGQLEYDEEALPPMSVSTGTVVSIDYDADGDLDLFVGGRLIPGKYPFAPNSYMLENQNDRFTVAEVPGLEELGLVNGAVSSDFDSDGLEDLIVVGEWTPVIFLKNNGSGFSRVTIPGTENLKGWWFSITEMDANADGRPDYLVGNLGKNNKFKSGLKLHCSDFDGNGTFDIVLSTEVDGLEYPVRGKECSTQQMPFIETRFPTYKDFALAELSDIIDTSKQGDAIHLSVDDFSSYLLLRNDAGFEKIKLPPLAQIAPIRDSLPIDINDDGHLDVIAVGNLYNTEVETPRYDAGMGVVLLGDGTGHFEAVISGDSGFRVVQDSRRIALLRTEEGSKVIVANNHSKIMVFDLK